MLTEYSLFVLNKIVSLDITASCVKIISLDITASFVKILSLDITASDVNKALTLCVK